MLNDKKKRFFVVNLLIIGLMIMIFSNGSNKVVGTSVQPGDEFTYVVNKYEVGLTAGEIEDSFTEFKIGDDQFSPGTDSKITLTVLEVSEVLFFGTSIVYEVKKDSTVTNLTSNLFTLAFLPLTVVVPFIYLNLVAGEDVNLSISNNIGSIPFILPIDNATDPAWDDLKEFFSNQSISVTTDDSDLSYSISNSEKDGDYYAQAGFDGTIKNATTNDELTMNSEILLVYELSTGVLQGTRLFIDGTGTIDGKPFSAKYDVEIFLEGFDLPAKAGANGVFGFEIATAFVGLLFVIAYTVRKRRN
jgi:hypothetical protein